jgi:hypothetical protein
VEELEGLMATMVLPIGSQVTGFGFEERAGAGPLTLVTGIKDHAAAALFSSFFTLRLVGL